MSSPPSSVTSLAFGDFFTEYITVERQIIKDDDQGGFADFYAIAGHIWGRIAPVSPNPRDIRNPAQNTVARAYQFYGPHGTEHTPIKLGDRLQVAGESLVYRVLSVAVVSDVDKSEFYQEAILALDEPQE